MERAVIMNLILFSFGKITTKVFNRSVRVKYVVCSPTRLVLNLIELLSSTVWRSAHYLRRKNVTKNDVYVLNIKARFIFFDRQNHNITAVLMHSFRIWYAQWPSLAKRLTLNLIEFIHLKVWRSFYSLAVKNFMKNWTTTTSTACLQNPTARLSFQNCLAVIPIFSRETSFSLNWMHPIENLTVV